MQIANSVTVDWTTRVPSNSMLRDALGIWNHHLSIQEEFTPGITSVTRRARYYTIWAYYWEYLYKERIIQPKDFEKLFILASLAHHDGNSQTKDLQQMYNNQKFAETWNDIDVFNLNFDINGFGWTYYNRQMGIFRCAWTDEFGDVHTSSITSKLANSLHSISPNCFKRREFSKSELKKIFDGFCVCQISENDLEKQILSKLMFGFFSERRGIWDIDDDEYSDFEHNLCQLDFIDRPVKRNLSSDYYSVREQNLRRRNTLFLFLNVIENTSPPINDIQQFIWDAIYFQQHSHTKESIPFGNLEKVRQYWEYHQLNIFYVYFIEKMLELIQNLVIQNVGTPKNQIIQNLDHSRIYRNLSERLKTEVDENTSLIDIIDAISTINGIESKSTLNSELNETQIYRNLKGDDSEYLLSESAIMLGLLYLRYHQNSKFISEIADEKPFGINTLEIERLFDYIQKNGAELLIIPFFSDLFRIIVNRHLLESAQRFAYGTRNWIFTEEEDRLYSAREPISITDRDNRWASIRTLLLDLQFIEQNEESQFVLTEKGREWLEKIQ